MGVETIVSSTGARRTLRRLELEAYASVVTAFRAQGPLNGAKKTALELLCKQLGISGERHRAEVRRAVNDELLSSVAGCISSTDTDLSWRKEGQKLASTNPRFVSRQVTHIPQTLTSVLAASTIGPLVEKKGEEPAKTTSVQLQNALKLIISQKPLHLTKPLGRAKVQPKTPPQASSPVETQSPIKNPAVAVSESMSANDVMAENLTKAVVNGTEAHPKVSPLGDRHGDSVPPTGIQPSQREPPSPASKPEVHDHKSVQYRKDSQKQEQAAPGEEHTTQDTDEKASQITGQDQPKTEQVIARKPDEESSCAEVVKPSPLLAAKLEAQLSPSLDEKGPSESASETVRMSKETASAESIPLSPKQPSTLPSPPRQPPTLPPPPRQPPTLPSPPRPPPTLPPPPSSLPSVTMEPAPTSLPSVTTQSTPTSAIMKATPTSLPPATPATMQTPPTSLPPRPVTPQVPPPESRKRPASPDSLPLPPVKRPAPPLLPTPTHLQTHTPTPSHTPTPTPGTPSIPIPALTPISTCSQPKGGSATPTIEPGPKIRSPPPLLSMGSIPSSPGTPLSSEMDSPREKRGLLQGLLMSVPQLEPTSLTTASQLEPTSLITTSQLESTSLDFITSVSQIQAVPLTQTAPPPQTGPTALRLTSMSSMEPPSLRLDSPVVYTMAPSLEVTTPTTPIQEPATSSGFVPTTSKDESGCLPQAVAMPTSELTMLVAPPSSPPPSLTSTLAPPTSTTPNRSRSPTPTTEALIQAVCSDPSASEDPTSLATQLGLDFLDPTLLNISDLMQLIQPGLTMANEPAEQVRPPSPLGMVTENEPVESMESQLQVGMAEPTTPSSHVEPLGSSCPEPSLVMGPSTPVDLLLQSPMSQTGTGMESNLSTPYRMEDPSVDTALLPDLTSLAAAADESELLEGIPPELAATIQALARLDEQSSMGMSPTYPMQ